jgi:heme/copper-type cytochrome/quinol oxidase subunit 2
MNPAIRDDLIQLVAIFICLLIVTGMALIILVFRKRIQDHLKKEWRLWHSIFIEVDWLGLFMLIGLILAFMCKGPILFF